jgi:hypothetical protein
MSEQEPSTYRPFVFTVIEDDGVNVIIEVSEEDYQADLAAGIDEEATMKPGLLAILTWVRRAFWSCGETSFHFRTCLTMTFRGLFTKIV